MEYSNSILSSYHADNGKFLCNIVAFWARSSTLETQNQSECAQAGLKTQLSKKKILQLFGAINTSTTLYYNITKQIPFHIPTMGRSWRSSASIQVSPLLSLSLCCFSILFFSHQPNRTSPSFKHPFLQSELTCTTAIQMFCTQISISSLKSHFPNALLVLNFQSPCPQTSIFSFLSLFPWRDYLVLIEHCSTSSLYLRRNQVYRQWGQLLRASIICYDTEQRLKFSKVILRQQRYL